MIYDFSLVYFVNDEYILFTCCNGFITTHDLSLSLLTSTYIGNENLNYIRIGGDRDLSM